MNIAITIWGDLISPVFETSQTLLLVEVVDGRVVGKIKYPLCGTPYVEIEVLRRQKRVDLLLCGALCVRGFKRLQESGLELIPFLSGEVELVLDCHCAGDNLERFAMPGCRGQCCRRGPVVRS